MNTGGRRDAARADADSVAVIGSGGQTRPQQGAPTAAWRDSARRGFRPTAREPRADAPRGRPAAWPPPPVAGMNPREFPGVSLAGGSSLVVFKASHHRDAAFRLIEFLSRPAQQIAFYRLTGDLPARTTAWE